MCKRRGRFTAATLILALCAGLLSGCTRTAEGGAGVGALSGAAVGAGVGLLIDDSAEAAVIGGLAGALAGGIVGYAVGRQMESRDEALANDPYLRHEYEQSGMQEVLDIRELHVEPSSVRAGDRLNVQLVHSYVSAVDTAKDFEVRVQLTDFRGQPVLDQSQSTQFQNGTYSSTITLLIPRNLPPGTYGVDVAMRTGQAADNASGVVQVL